MMMRMTMLLVCGWISGNAPAGEMPAPPRWKFTLEEDGVRVFQKDDEGTGVVSFRGETLLPGTPELISRVMADNNLAHQWMPMVRERRSLKSISPTERIELTHVGMPWPLTDRYFINQGKAERLPQGALRLFVKSIDAPPQDWLHPDKVLGFLHYSEFLLTPRSPDSTHVTLEVNSDPRGLIPKWMVNMVQKTWPVKFFRGLRQQLDGVGGGGSYTH